MTLSRDELAARFAVALATSGWNDPLANVTLAHKLADAFVAEAAKRAPVTDVQFGSPDLLTGCVLRPDGLNADYSRDGYAGDVAPDRALVKIRATSREHAERVVAAMLAAGRGVK